MGAAVFVVAIMFVFACVTASDDSDVQRVARSFPYSLSMLRAMRPQESEFNSSPRLLYPALPASPVEREIADIIESLDVDSFGRERRSAPVFKRYACRFKFCRIFDA